MKYLHFTKGLSLGLTPEFYDQIKEIAGQQRIPMAQWIRNVAEKEIKASQVNVDGRIR